MFQPHSMRRVALCTLAIVSAAGLQASSFSFDQYFAVSDPFFNGSQNLIYSYDTQQVEFTPYQIGDYFFYYSLPFNSDQGLFHYSYGDGRYTEAIYLTDYAL